MIKRFAGLFILFLGLQEKRGLAVLFITHDIALARKVSDRMAVMSRQKILGLSVVSLMRAGLSRLNVP